MKVSEPWLNTLIDLSISTEVLASQLTNAGIEVDSIEKFPGASEYAVLTLKIPANRGDCLSMEGVAREVAVLNVLPFSGIEIVPTVPNIQDTFPIQVEAKEACPRYVARIIQNINPNVETPGWMLKRLEEAGLRSVSAIVDIGNYVMLELGQPLHAFDWSKIIEGIQIRFAKPGETIITLESKNIELDPQTLIIADKQKPLAIAGIIGGLESAVNHTTRTILLESAYFEPNQLRSSAKRLKIRTESSLRFERGMDPNLQVRALERATQLLLEIVGGNAGPMMEQVDALHLPQSPKILLRLAKVKDILGICPVEEIQDILTRLGMKLSSTSTGTGFEVIPPSFRVDILREVDLIEEIARIYGYDRIPKSNPLVGFEFIPIPEAKLEENRLKQTLVDRGYYETITYSFLSAEYMNQILPSQPALALANPISEELAVMRTSLWPGLLKAVQYNQRRSQIRLKLFETGLCFIEQERKTLENGFKSGFLGKKSKDEFSLENSSRNSLSVEDKSLLQIGRIAGVSVGTPAPEQWGIKAQGLDFYDMKNDVEALLALTRRSDFSFEVAEHEALHPGQCARIMLANEELGYIGALHPRLLKELELQGPLFLFEMDLSLLSQSLVPSFQDVSKFPMIRRDIAMIVDKMVLAAELKSAIVHYVGSLARDVVVFDVYQGKGIEPGRKSVAIGLTLQHPSRTFVESEVNDLMQGVILELTNKFQATLRE